MAIRTYVDGGKQAITFNNDTQPVAVYVDEDLQENVSFVPDTVQGTGSVEYTSEYKKNHIEYEVQGTTIQDGTPTPETPIPIENANNEGINLYDGAKAIDGVQLNTSGVEVANTNYFTSDYIEIEPNTKYSSYMFVEMPTSNTNLQYRIAWYDENKAFISMGLNYSQPRLRGARFTGTSPTNAKFVRLSTDITSKYLMFNKGDFAQYKAYNSNLSVKVHSNNLLKLVDGEFVVGGVTFTIKNGIITLNGIIEGTGVLVVGFGFEPVFLQPSKTYIIRLQKYTNNKNYISGADTDIGYVGGGGKAYTSPTSGNVLATIGLYINKGEQYDNFSFAPALYLQGKETAYEKPFSETINIPTSVTVGSTNVPLLMSAYDKLTVDRLNNKVVYTEGSATKTFNGTEGWIPNYWGHSQTGKNYYQLNDVLPFPIVTYKGFSTHFMLAKWLYTSNNSFSTEYNSDGKTSIVVFRTDGVMTRDEFKVFLAEKYAEGDPVTVLLQRQTPIEHDITSTELGQKLLNLDTQNQTNYFEITSNANAPQTPINFTYAKWGGRDENNNNT